MELKVKSYLDCWRPACKNSFKIPWGYMLKTNALRDTARALCYKLDERQRIFFSFNLICH